MCWFPLAQGSGKTNHLNNFVVNDFGKKRKIFHSWWDSLTYDIWIESGSLFTWPLINCHPDINFGKLCYNLNYVMTWKCPYFTKILLNIAWTDELNLHYAQVWTLSCGKGFTNKTLTLSPQNILNFAKAKAKMNALIEGNSKRNVWHCLTWPKIY